MVAKAGKKSITASRTMRNEPISGSAEINRNGNPRKVATAPSTA